MFETIFDGALMVLAVSVLFVATIMFIATVVSMVREFTWTYQEEIRRFRRTLARISRALVTRA